MYTCSSGVGRDSDRIENIHYNTLVQKLHQMLNPRIVYHITSFTFLPYTYGISTYVYKTRSNHFLNQL